MKSKSSESNNIVELISSFLDIKPKSNRINKQNKIKNLKNKSQKNKEKNVYKKEVKSVIDEFFSFKEIDFNFSKINLTDNLETNIDLSKNEKDS
jgi:hypothetical protein